MRNSVSPAVVACLYSLLLVAVALFMGRRPADEDADEGRIRLFRGTAVSICLVAVMLPALRLVTTRELSDVLVLTGAIAAAIAAVAFLMRSRAVEGEAPRTRDDVRRRAREAQAAREASRAAARRRKAANSRAARKVHEARQAAGSDVVEVVPYTPQHVAEEIAAEIAAGKLQHVMRIPASVEGTHRVALMTGPTPESDAAGEALQDVDTVIGDVTQKLRLG